MISNELQVARDYTGDKISLVPEAQRPKFHLTPDIGWMNDPNGFSFYKGEYHLFYQYHPFSTNWGPMHWGHAKTKDFIKWERLPIALAPDKDYDNFGCFSGTGIELPDGRHLLVYTSVMRQTKNDGEIEDFQQQSIAIGDGENYEKALCNPVIKTSQIPKGNSILDFRDPKIYEKDGQYYIVVGSRGKDGSGEILRYKSHNLIDFEYDTLLYKSNNEYGKMWECPDYFELDNKMVLAASPQEMEESDLEFINANGTLYVIGEERDGKLIKEEVHACDYGIDFYAPQTLKAKDGRRIMIAWMQAWESSNYAHEDKQIYGAMTLPRELSMKNGRVYANPVKELKNYYKDTVSFSSLEVFESPREIENISGRVFDMTLLLKNDFESFTINLACDETHSTSIIVNKTDSTITLDRTNCGIDKSILSKRKFAINSFDELKLRLLMDKNSIELFVNDGEKTATMLTYTDLSAKVITFEAKGKALIDIEFNSLNL